VWGLQELGRVLARFRPARAPSDSCGSRARGVPGAWGSAAFSLGGRRENGAGSEAAPVASPAREGILGFDNRDLVASSAGLGEPSRLSRAGWWRLSPVQSQVGQQRWLGQPGWPAAWAGGCSGPGFWCLSGDAWPPGAKPQLREVQRWSERGEKHQAEGAGRSGSGPTLGLGRERLLPLWGRGCGPGGAR